MVKIAKLFLLCFLSGTLHAGDIVIGGFSGLNNDDNSLTLDPSEATDLLNVNVVPGGKGVGKREGFGLYKTLTLSTAPIHGGHFFQDLSGNNVQLWAGGARLNAIVGGATPIQVSTMSDTATVQCADAEGFAYCLNSSRDIAVRTDGTTTGTSFQQGVPLGTILTFTPDRMVVAGISGSPNTLSFSKANTYTTNTVGPLEADAFTEVIAAKGSRITHVRYACGKVLWWKDTSFGYWLGVNQYDAQVVTISPDIGTLDNSSDEYNGHVYFRGQDNHIYDYDCSNVVRLSRAISPTVSASGRRKSSSWTQSSQAEFSAGLTIPQINLSTMVSVGDLTVSSFSAIDTAVADFSQGTASNITIQATNMVISTNAVEVTNNGFESNMDNWTNSGVGNWNDTASETTDCGTTSPQSGNDFAEESFGGSSGVLTASVLDAISGTSYGSTVINYAGGSCTWTLRTITVSASALRKRVVIKFAVSGTNTAIITSDSFVSNSRNVTFYSASDTFDPPGGVPRYYAFFIDTVAGTPKSDIAAGNYTSRVFDTGFTSSTVTGQAGWTANDFHPYFELQHSIAGGGPFRQILVSSGTNATTNRYVRYISSFTVGSSSHAATTFDDATVLSRSTGTFYSAVNNAPSLRAWTTFGVTDSVTGNASITYYVRASTGSFQVNSSTPTWTAQIKNSTVNYSTGTYMQMRADFLVTAATETPTLNDFTFNWFEGSASDKAYIKYFNDNVWISVSSGTGGTNNQIQRWDLINQTWLLDNIPANGMIVDSDRLYLGSPTDGKIHLFGGVNTDNAANITAFWQSKSFAGDDPFVKNEYVLSDTIVKNSSGTLSVTYTVDSSSPTTKNISLYDSVRSIVKRSYNLPAGKVGGFYSVKFYDSSAYQWEVLGHRVRYNPLAWKVE